MVEEDVTRDPDATYGARLAARERDVERMQGEERNLSIARLLVFVIVCATFWLGVVRTAIPALAFVLPLVGFVGLVVRHNQVIERRSAGERAATGYRDGIARRAGAWRSDHTGVSGRDPDGHPYALDLDIVGTDGLLARISTALTASGREQLASWLLHPARAPVARARQDAVKELREALDLREALHVLGAAHARAIHGDALVRWGSEPRSFGRSWHRPVAVVSSLAWVGAIAAFLAGVLPWLPPLAVCLHLLVHYGAARRAGRVVRAVDAPARELALVASFTERLGAERFEAERLATLVDTLRTEGVPAQSDIARLTRLVDLLDSARNQLFAPLALMLHWHVHLALAVEAWRERVGPKIATWITTIGELEALAVLGGYAYENPEDVFPEIGDTPGILAEDLRHPHLPRDACVGNDVRLDASAPLLVVSGSNMSGKSTLLRSVGVNVALALAGAPVRARVLRLSALQLGTSLRVVDSLDDGRSRFLAELERLKQLVDLSRGERTLLFLVDELLSGTNSHDRRIGAEAVMRSLVSAGAFGILTTHDLALTEIADTLDTARNAHFEDHMENGEMRFDYRLRGGVVTKSNAIALMRRVGLDV